MKVIIIVTLLALVGAVVSQDSGNVTSPDGWVLFKQCSSPWGPTKLGTCSQTVCDAGCAMSSVAMYMATKGWSGNPGTLNSWLTANGGYAGGCNIAWGTVDKLGYTTFMGKQSVNYATICSGASQMHGVIINVRGGSHWVLVTGCAGNNVLNVNDPGFNQATYNFGDIVGQVAVYH